MLSFVCNAKNAGRLIASVCHGPQFLPLCPKQLRPAPDLKTVRCDGSDAIAELFAADGSKIPVFPRSIEKKLRELGTGIELRPLPGCRRAAVLSTCANADIPFGGELVFYDFERRREIARMPYAAPEDWDYPNKQTLDQSPPLFCNHADLGIYVEQLLSRLLSEDSPPKGKP